MTLYAARTTQPPTPENAARGGRFTGWVHEGDPPWRVLVSDDPELMRQAIPPSIGPVVVYDGDEDVRHVLDWFPGLAR